MGRKGEVDVAERLFTYREAMGWSQDETARRAGTSRGSVVLTEAGKTNPRLPTLRRFAKAFGVSLEEFLSDREPKPHPVVGPSELIERLWRVSAEDRRMILRGLHDDWTTDSRADAVAMEVASEFERETGASADDLRHALISLDPLEARRLLTESQRHRADVARYWWRLLFEAVAKGDLGPAEAAEKAAVFGGAA